jgi:hypothetical protein
MARGARQSKPSATAAPSVVEKLSMLRSFVGGGSTFSETDLSNCLRQSGYIVEVAAERLMTGQYQPPAKRLKTSAATSTQSIASVPAAAAAANRQEVRSSRPPPLAKQQRSSPTASTSSTTRNTKHPTPKTARRHPPAPVLVTPQTPKRILSKKEKDSDSSSEESSSCWLLCQRWVSDGVCTQRNGSLDYKETLQVENTDAGMLRFRGSRIQGQFPKHLSQVMSPLLAAAAPNSLLRLEAHALMEDRFLPIGGHVAFSLR